MNNPQQTTRSDLARAFVQGGIINHADAESLLAQASVAGISFIEQLAKSRVAEMPKYVRFLSDAFGYPLLDVNAMDPGTLESVKIDTKLISTHRVVPLYKRGNRLSLGISDPTNVQAIEAVRFQTGMVVDPIVIDETHLGPLVLKLVEPKREEAAASGGGGEFNFELEEPPPEEQAGNALPKNLTGGDDGVEDAPIVKFIQKALTDAINDGASDIHFEPYEKSYRIRFRVDGNLREISSPPLAIKDKIASRIKVISRLNIAEKRVPQDGRMRLTLSPTKAIDFRVSTLPTMYGEKIVLRILDPSSATLGIDALGYEPEQKAVLLDAIHRPYGMVLVTGPTGSGKTVSLYTCLNILNGPGINISTAEDPAEIPLPGINQVNVDEKQGLTFPAALKAFLRQDPDIIMVGEIRDLETAEIAIKAAQTGHMVLSTLHTNDAPSTLTRMLNMGIPAFNIASSVLLITAQRLVRRLCNCKKPLDNIPPKALLDAGFAEQELDGKWTLYGPNTSGCERCRGSGYKGRVGVYQVMPISEEMQRIIMKNGTSIDIAQQAKKEGVNDLRRSGLLKVKQGLTSLEEILGSTNA